MTARVTVSAFAASVFAGAIRTAPEPLPAEPPFAGVTWSYVVPAILFAIAFGATVLLYRHFAGRDR